MLQNCPNCLRPDYVPGRKFHWCGVPSKQCAVCGHDFEPAEPKMTTKQKFPFKCTFNDMPAECLGWDSPGHLVIRIDDDDNRIILSTDKTLLLLKHLNLKVSDLQPKKSQKSEVVSAKEWDRFQRFKETSKDLEEISSELMLNWRSHLAYLRDHCGVYDDDDILEEMEDVCRRLPRTIKYIRTGHYPSADVEDENLGYYDDNIVNDNDYPTYQQHYDYRPTAYAPKPKKVRILIEDISTGDL